MSEAGYPGPPGRSPLDLLSPTTISTRHGAVSVKRFRIMGGNFSKHAWRDDQRKFMTSP